MTITLWHSSPFWWSALRNWFSSTSKTHPSQFGPSPVCIQCQQTHRRCHLCCPLHSLHTHVENNKTYIRILFVDYSSAFNTISPMKLIGNLSTLDFLTNRPQTVLIGGHTYSTFVLYTGAPQGCMFSPLLFTLYTHYREAIESILKLETLQKSLL